MQFFKNLIKRINEPAILFVPIALVFGTLYATITPPLWGTDETSHFARVYQISRGVILPPMEKDNFGGKIPENLVTLSDYVKQDLLDNKGGGSLSRKDITSSEKYRELGNIGFSKNHTQYMWSASYSIASYPGSLLGVVLANILGTTINQTILFARIGALISYIAIVFLALWVIKSTKLKWVFFIVALLPISLYQASVVTADNIANGLALLLIALVIRLCIEGYRNNNKNLLYLALITAALLPVIKINYILVSASLLVLPAYKIRYRKLHINLKYFGLFVSVVCGILWSLAVRVTAHGPISQRPDGAPITPNKQLLFILSSPLEFILITLRTVVHDIDSYLQSLFVLIGWNYVTIPTVCILLLSILLLVAMLYAKSDLKDIKNQVYIMAGFSLLGLVSIFVALYMAFNPTGHRVIEGVQGRYFLPFFVPILLAISAILPLEIRIKHKVAPYLFSFVSVSVLAVSVAYYVAATY